MKHHEGHRMPHKKHANTCNTRLGRTMSTLFRNRRGLHQDGLPGGDDLDGIACRIHVVTRNHRGLAAEIRTRREIPQRHVLADGESTWPCGRRRRLWSGSARSVTRQWTRLSPRRALSGGARRQSTSRSRGSYRDARRCRRRSGIHRYFSGTIAGNLALVLRDVHIANAAPRAPARGPRSTCSTSARRIVSMTATNVARCGGGRGCVAGAAHSLKTSHRCSCKAFSDPSQTRRLGVQRNCKPCSRVQSKHCRPHGRNAGAKRCR